MSPNAFDSDGNIKGEFIGAGGESIAYREMMKVIKFPVDGDPRISVEDLIGRICKINYPADSARVPEIRHFRKLLPAEKSHLETDERFARVLYVYETDYIPNLLVQWTPELVHQALWLFRVLAINGFAITDIAGQNWRTDNNGRLYFIDAGDIRYWDNVVKHGEKQTSFLFYLYHILQYAFGSEPTIPLIDILTRYWPGWKLPVWRDGGYGHIDWTIAAPFIPKEFHKMLKAFQNLTLDKTEEIIMHVGDAVELIKQGKVGAIGQPTLMDIMKSIYGDYHLADVAEDLTLSPSPNGYSYGKWQVIAKAAKALDRQQFSWLDLGACYGIFGFMLAQEYPQSTGVLNNIVQAELVANRFVAHLKGMSDRVKTQDCSWKDCTGTYDLVLCMSLVHHLLGSGHTVKSFCQGLMPLVNVGGILVLEVPLEKDFQGGLLVKTHLGRCVDVEDFVPELPGFELLWKEKVDYAGNTDINRNVGVFRRVA